MYLYKGIRLFICFFRSLFFGKVDSSLNEQMVEPVPAAAEKKTLHSYRCTSYFLGVYCHNPALRATKVYPMNEISWPVKGLHRNSIRHSQDVKHKITYFAPAISQWSRYSSAEHAPSVRKVLWLEKRDHSLHVICWLHTAVYSLPSRSISIYSRSGQVRVERSLFVGRGVTVERKGGTLE